MAAQPNNQPDYWQAAYADQRKRADANLRLAAERAAEIGELREDIARLSLALDHKAAWAAAWKHSARTWRWRTGKTVSLWAQRSKRSPVRNNR